MPRLLTLMLLLFLFGCSTPSGRFTTRSFDGLELAYDVSGDADPTLVFVHGWSCERGQWRSQVAIFDDEYRTVAIDLAGHGESGRARDEWTMPLLARDVEAVVRSIPGPVVLIGHSMGGPVCCLAAARLGTRVVGVVGVDTLHNVEQVMTADAMAGAIDSLERDFLGASERFVRQMFPRDADTAVVESVIDDAHRATPAVGIALMRSFVGFSLKDALANCPAPVYCINASETDISVNRKYAPSFDAVEVSGVGHYLMLEKPHEFNRHLSDALTHLASQAQRR